MSDLLFISDLDIADLLLTGFYFGVLVSFSIGLVGYGINYALKFFKL